MNKLDMAHEWAIETMRKDGFQKHYMQETVRLGWEYADAMQAEADKREPSGFPNVLRGACGEIVAVRVDDKEWQPDWSQAPEWADWWAIDKDLVSFWHEDKPKFDEVEFYQCGVFCNAPSFNYQGDWRNSLRKRPQ